MEENPLLEILLVQGCEHGSTCGPTMLDFNNLLRPLKALIINEKQSKSSF
jgi:hypothetical protein